MLDGRPCSGSGRKRLPPCFSTPGARRILRFRRRFKFWFGLRRRLLRSPTPVPVPLWRLRLFFLSVYLGLGIYMRSVGVHAIRTKRIPEATFSLILHELPRAARWQVLHAPDRKSSKEMHIENRPRPVAQWEQGGMLTLPRDAIRHALRVCTRSLSVDFSSGSSFPGYHGIGLI
jgi:hypothetical protein